MEISLSTPEKTIYSGQTNDVLLVADKGQINLLERHANLITLVSPGRMILKGEKDSTKSFDVSDGVLKVEGSRVVVLCGKITKID